MNKLKKCIDNEYPNWVNDTINEIEVWDLHFVEIPPLLMTSFFY